MKFLNRSGEILDLVRLQNSLSQVFAFLTGLLMLFLGFFGHVIGLSDFIVIVKFLLAFPFFVGFWVMKRYGHHQLVQHPLLGMGFFAITINYFHNEGYNGPSIYTIFIFIVVISIVTHGWKRIAWLAFALVLYSFLFFGEVQGWFTTADHYADTQSYFWDHWVTVIYCTVFTFLGVYVFVEVYQIQNKLLNQLREENERNLGRLVEANSKKNQLIALLSHDLRNPIGILSGSLELVDMGMFGKDEFHLVLKDLKNQSFHLHKILNNTLNWVMAEMEERELVTEKMSLKSLTQDIVDTMQVQAERKDQEIQFHFIGVDETLDIASNEVKIILKNLLDNAIKFSPLQAKIDLNLEVNAPYIKWEVRNDGKFIPEEVSRNLFEFKVKSSVGTQKEKGTGLGLPLSKKIADRLGMELGFDGDPSRGNVFYLAKRAS